MSSSETILIEQNHPCIEEKIYQTVIFGSVFLALENGFFTYEELFEWLQNAGSEDKTLIAYKFICMKKHPNEHYMSNGDHFLVLQPEYTPIAIGFGLDINIPESINKDLETILPLSTKISYYLDNNLEYIFHQSLIILSQDLNASEYIQSLDDLEICYRARVFPYIRGLSGDEINKELIKSDWFEKFRYNEKLIHYILDRVEFLKKEAPIYYKDLAFSKYYKVVEKLYKEKKLFELEKDKLLCLKSHFPNIIDEKILDYSPLAYKISLLEDDIAGYVLGFPIQNMIPNNIQIQEAIHLLMEIGIDAYSKRIKDYVKSTYTPSLLFSTEINYPNSTDVILEDIDNYLPFDIVSFQIGTHMYRFTRSEYKQLISTKKNHWTNDWLPPSVLSTIKTRYEASKDMGLPKCYPVKETLEKIEKNEYFKEEEISEEPSSIAEPSEPNPLLILRGILENGNFRVLQY